MTTATEKFEQMLEDLTAIFRSHFAGMTYDAQEEAVQEATAAAWQNYQSLVARGAEDQANVHTLAYYAAKGVAAGRMMASPANVKDAMHAPATVKAARGIVVLGDVAANLAADHRATPAEIACLRIDLAAWLDTLTDHRREIAARLAAGFTTSEVARLMGVTSSAISIARRVLERSWLEFQGVGE